MNLKKKTTLKNNTLTEIPFGYKYDNETNKLIIDEPQANIVSAVIDLRITYLLEYIEVYYLCINQKTIDEIIADRIEEIYDILEDYNFEITNPFENNNIIELLKQESKVKNEIIKPLASINTKINFGKKKKYEVVAKKISRIIKLIEQRNDLIKKYDFKKIADTINEYNNSLKNKPVYSKTIEINKSATLNKSHKEIIDKDTWGKTQNLYNQNQVMNKEDIERE